MRAHCLNGNRIPQRQQSCFPFPGGASYLLLHAGAPTHELCTKRKSLPPDGDRMEPLSTPSTNVQRDHAELTQDAFRMGILSRRRPRRNLAIKVRLSAAPFSSSSLQLTTLLKHQQSRASKFCTAIFFSCQAISKYRLLVLFPILPEHSSPTACSHDVVSPHPRIPIRQGIGFRDSPALFSPGSSLPLCHFHPRRTRQGCWPDWTA